MLFQAGQSAVGLSLPKQAPLYLQCAEMCGYGHGIMGAAAVVHSEESYEITMAQIQNGTYESHYQKRVGTKTGLPSKTSQVDDEDSFAALLASVF